MVDDEGDLQEMVDDHLVKNVDTDGDGVEDSAYFNVGGYGIALEDYLF